ncbi:MAG: NUDIX domain-containing protein [Candidatus Eisenbacteria bacterium]|uniref:NUDIX domain-containing protein n=1 Tax=Eiseniibacteriota bacterium TaxID=2212470 RepID=A0A948RZL0_UNCEI|nr:NUDIX domain-containing protein [Candidatus Eisenbacteria bacterium]
MRHSLIVSAITLTSLVQTLRARLAAPLPGAAGQALMAPRPRPGWAVDWGESPHTRTAATLALFYEKEKRLRLLLTMRTETLDSHRGQISLPGGGVEPGETF